jgi:Fe-S oxidoreductase
VEPADRQTRMICAMGDALRSSRALAVMLEICTGCGACAEACHSYLGTDDLRNVPAARADVVRDAYARYFTPLGRMRGGSSGKGSLDADDIERWVDAFFQCNACRRCAQACPLGIDTGEITLAARNILARSGVASAFMVDIARNELETGNNRGLQPKALLDACEFLQDELKDDTGRSIPIPVDQPAPILFVPSSSEFFVNINTLMSAAKIFHLLGAEWTISSSIPEAANYGFFFDADALRRHNRRLRDAAAAVGAEQVIMGECGHGWRTAKMCSEAVDESFPFRLSHVLEYVAEHLAELPLRPLRMRATLHDPCNYGRGAGLIEPPRQIMRAVVSDFVEMTPNREQNYCCGGGAAMLMDEMAEVRVKLGKMKAEQIRALLPLDYVALPCASCKSQVPLLLKHYGMAEIKTGGVLDLVGGALLMPEGDG